VTGDLSCTAPSGSEDQWGLETALTGVSTAKVAAGVTLTLSGKVTSGWETRLVKTDGGVASFSDLSAFGGAVQVEAGVMEVALHGTRGSHY
jgi:autotransporter-associated beta strand protein